MNAIRSFLIGATMTGVALFGYAALAADRDGDGFDDTEDNCLEVANPSQCDTDGDGIGNHCDADLDNNCIVNSFDLTILRDNFGAAGPNPADLNCNNTVNTFDLSRMRQAFGSRPGPSSLAKSICDVRCGTGHADNPLTMKWTEPPRSGQPIPNTALNTEICPDGARMTVDTEGLIKGHAYTLWFGWFDNPDACMFPPPQPESGNSPKIRCGLLDLFHDGVEDSPDGNFIFGDGAFAMGGAGGDSFEALVLKGVDPKGTPYTGQNCGGEGQPGCTDCDSDPDDGVYEGPACQCMDGECRNDWAAVVQHDDDNPGRLRNPETAEYHAVFLNHGPPLPGHDDQTTSHDGGCLGAQENDPDDPTDDVAAEPNWPCRGEQVSGALSEVPFECMGGDGILPECIAGVITPQPGGFVYGRGVGKPTADTYAEVEIVGVAQNIGEGTMCEAEEGQGIGLCTINHYTEDLVTGERTLFFTAKARLDCVSVPNTVAYTTGEVLEVTNTENQKLKELKGTPFALTIYDTTNVVDEVRINFSAADTVAVEELTVIGGLEDGQGSKDELTGCGCGEGWGGFSASPDSFWVAD